jgi:hypothetical protein
VGKATMHGGHTIAIHSVIFEKNKKINPQPAQYEKNKIDKDQFKKKINHKKKEKKLCSEIL